MKKIITAGTCALLLCTGAWALDPVRREQVELAQGAAAQKLSGKIKGHETVEYSLAVPAGGELGIKLSSANPSLYFNVSVEGADEALFVGSRDGQRYQAKVTAAGRYKVSVYLMRNAARKNQVASYLLDIGRSGS